MFQKNLVLFIVGFFLFISFLFFSLQNPKDLSQDFISSLTSYETGFLEIDDSGKSRKILDDSNLSGKTILYRDSLLNSVFAMISSKDDIKVEKTTNKKTFYINSGIYLLDLNEVGINYEIKSPFFSGKLLSSGKFFIDNRDEKNIIFFSFDSISELSLTDRENKNTYTNLHIYPHMLFSFNSSRNFYLKNADLFRIQAIDKVSYIGEQVYSMNKTLNSDFLNKLSSQDELEKYTFLEKTLNFICSKDSKSKINLETIKSSNIKGISGLYYIEKYTTLFYNNEKKAIYYKNIVLQNIKYLLNSEEKDNSKINEILENLSFLKDLSLEDYDSSVETIKGFYKELVQNNSSSDFFALENFQKLMYKINNISISDSEIESYSYLNSLYGAYDTNQFDKSFFYYFREYIHSYFYKSFAINTDKNGILIFQTKNLQENIEKTKKMDYFSFLLYNIIYNSSDLKDSSRDDLLETINDYIKINNLIISSLGDDKRSLAQVYYNNDIASKILLNFKTIFFEDTRDENNLLKLNRDVNLLNFTNEQFDKLESFFRLLSFFYSRNLSLLDATLDKDKIVLNSYNDITNTFSEYILAAKDYDNYTLQYDKIKSDLIGTKTVSEIEIGNYVFSRENFISYINFFNEVSLDSMILSIEADHYKVENLIIAGYNFSFDLYPNNANRITNLVINGEKKTISYKLDSIKTNWDELHKNAYEEQTMALYDFKNFFINTFISTSQTTKEIFTDTRKNIDEDKAIIILKKDKLLGDKGEFKILNNFMPINYDNIFVEKVGDNYNISLKGITLSIPFSVDLADSRKLSVEFSSDYIFSNTDHKFRNIKIKFLNDMMLENDQKVYDFDAKSFDISYDIDINSFADRIAPAIRRIYNNLNK